MQWLGRLPLSGNVSLPSATLNPAFLFATDGASLLQIIREMRYAADELAVVASLLRAVRDEVGDGTTVPE